MTGTIVELLIALITHALVGIFSSNLKYSKMRTFIIWGSWVAVQSALLWCAEFLLADELLQFFLAFVLALVGQYVIFFLTTTGKMVQRIFTMLTYSIFFCISMALFTMVKGTILNIHPILRIGILACMLSSIAVYFLCYVCPLCRSASKSITNGWVQMIFVNIVFLITVILSAVFPVKLSSFRDPGCLSYLFLSASILAVYPVMFSNINSMTQAAARREVNRQNKLLVALVDAEKAQIVADRQARHDRRHHNLVLLELANNNDLVGVREYLKHLVETESRVWGEIRFCDNMTVNTVLTVYEKRASKSGIAVRIEASASSDLQILPQDLVVVLANLFENAINATEKQKTDEKNIDITIRESQQRLLIKFENTFKERFSFDESCYGVGIRSVIATVKKYDGMYDFDLDDGIFSAKISLNLK